MSAKHKYITRAYLYGSQSDGNSASFETEAEALVPFVAWQHMPAIAAVVVYGPRLIKGSYELHRWEPS